MYTFNSTLETIVGVAQNVGKSEMTRLKTVQLGTNLWHFFALRHIFFCCYGWLQVFIILQLFFFNETLIAGCQLELNSKSQFIFPGAAVDKIKELNIPIRGEVFGGKDSTLQELMCRINEKALYSVICNNMFDDP